MITNTNLRISVLHWFDCLKQLRTSCAHDHRNWSGCLQFATHWI